MATAKKLPSGNWRVRAYIGDVNGKPKYKSFTASTKKEAEYKAAEYMLSNKHKNEPLSITLGDAYDRYIESKDAILSPSTVREYRRARSRDFQSLMCEKVCNITNEMIQSEVNKEAKSHSWKTVKDKCGLLSAVLKSQNPDFRLNVSTPKKKKNEIYIPTDEHIKLILDKVKGTEMEVPILLAAFGSLRRSEICALDLIEGDTIHVNKALVLNEYREFVLKSPKTYSGDRYIVIPHFVTEILNRERLPNGRFTNLNPNQITKRFSIILKELGIPHFKFHALRHYNASVMLAMGVPDKYAAARGGWGSTEVMRQIYQHLIDEKKVEVDNLINGHFEKISK